MCFFIARLHFLLLLLSFVRSFIHSLFSFHVLPFDLVVSQLDSYVSFQSLCLLLFWMDTMLPCNASSYVTEVICLVWCMYMLCTLHGCNFYLALRGDRSSTHATRASERLLCMGCILFFILLILFQESSENSFCWRIQINTQQFILRFDTRTGMCRYETVWSTHTHIRTHSILLRFLMFQFEWIFIYVLHLFCNSVDALLVCVWFTYIHKMSANMLCMYPYVINIPR